MGHDKEQPIKVFISYSHDSDEHRRNVLAVSERLRGDGIECVIDQYVQSPRQGWPRWMITQIRQADFVVVVCTEKYRHRFELDEQHGRGRGAKWEGAIITQQLYEEESLNSKFVPVLLGSREMDIPLILRGATHYDLTSLRDYTAFYRHVTNQPRVVPKAVSPDIVAMPPEKKPPKEIGAFLKAGQEAFIAGKFEEARSAYKSAQKLADAGGYVADSVLARVNIAGILWDWDRRPEAARDLLEGCLDDLQREDHESERASVLFQLGAVMGALGDFDRSESLLRQGLELDRKIGHELHEAQHLVQLGYQIGHRGASQEVLELTDQALQQFMAIYHSGRSDDKDDAVEGIACCYYQRAMVCKREAKLEDAESALFASLEWQRKTKPNHHLAKILREMAGLKFEQREIQQGLECLQEAMDVFGSLGHHLEQASCMDIMGRLCFTFGRREEASKWWAEAASVAIAKQDDREVAEFLFKLGRMHLGEGRIEDAKQLYERARDATGEKSEDRARCLAALARVAVLEDRPEERETLLREAIGCIKAELPTVQAAPRRADLLGQIGAFHQELEEYEEALAWTQKAYELYKATSIPHGTAQALGVIAHIKGCLGKKDEERKAYQELEKLVEGTPFHDIIVVTKANLSEFEMQDENLEEAKRLLRSAETLCRKFQLPYLDYIVLKLDHVESALAARQPADVGIDGLIDELYNNLNLCLDNKDGYLRYWTFSRHGELSANLRGSVGLHLMFLEEDLGEFERLASILKQYADWSLLAVPCGYPEQVFDVIPLTREMRVYGNTALLCYRSGDAEAAKEVFRDLPEAVRSGKVKLPEGLRYQRVAQGGTLSRYYITGRKEEDANLSGWSLALPPQVHQLISQNEAQYLKDNRSFFVYYNRKWAKDNLLRDLFISGEFRMIPVYRDLLERSGQVQLVASCAISLPVLSGRVAGDSSAQVRRVKQAIMQLLSCDQESAASALHQLSADVEALADTVNTNDHLDLLVYLLKWSDGLHNGVHPAIVVK